MKSILTKIFASLIAVVFILCLLYPILSKEDSAKTGENVITVFSWEDYIDEGYDNFSEANDVLQAKYANDKETLLTSVLDIFEEKTGIKVNYYSFATNEEMYNELMKDPSAVDLICPSEYMIMKMMEEELIQPYTMPDNYVKHGSTYIKDTFKKLGMETKDGKTYAIGYMWGTMGLIYDADKYSDQDFNSWANLFNEKFKGKFTIKDSLRDSYILAIAIVYKEELLQMKQALEDKLNQLENSFVNGTISEEEYLEQKKTEENNYNSELFKIFNRTDPKTIDKVGNVLLDIKDNLYGFEVDGGKSHLLTGKIDVNFAWSGDAVFSMEEGDDDKIDKYLRYVVPEEGSNVWFDGWVMTKGANVENSLKFLDFISDPEIAIRNMGYVGYTSCIAGDDVFNYVVDKFGDQDGNIKVDLSYFFGKDKNYEVSVFDGKNGTYRHLYAQYANNDTILRCAVMDNFDQASLIKINDMWNKVKLITFPTYAIVLIVVGILLIIAALIVYKFRDRIFRKVPSYVDGKIKHKNCKIISKKEIR